ncbi:MAG TPA: class I SAM-dependent methyltransferase [Marmoricola sp.]|nr:class I SAM-dependent methyltransferase [Marmoricola sp.]
MTQTAQPGSSSIQHPDYWWHRERAELLRVVLGPYLDSPARSLDVGSADAPSVGWMRGEHAHVSLDLFPDGLTPGEGVCGSATALPFADEVFDVVSAFDVVEHCEDDALAVAELARVLRPGGRLLLSVPAYQWAWSDHDVRAGHHRRYTRDRLHRLVEGAGLPVQRATYAFGAVFPLFVAERMRRRLRGPGRDSDRLPEVSTRTDRLLAGLCRLDARVLRRRDLPFGSSIFLAAVKPRG